MRQDALPPEWEKWISRENEIENDEENENLRGDAGGNSKGNGNERREEWEGEKVKSRMSIRASKWPRFYAEIRRIVGHLLVIFYWFYDVINLIAAPPQL
jgi:hypothetical protein